MSGGVIATTTRYDEREAFETIPCKHGIDGCMFCTDVWTDDKIDSERRAQFVDDTDLLQTTTTADVIRHSEKRLILLPVRVYAYALQARKWRAICIDDLQPLPKGEHDPFDDLVLATEQKRLIQALVRNQIRQFDSSIHSGKHKEDSQHEYKSMDIVRGKGRGLIVLLHGVPGTYP